MPSAFRARLEDGQGQRRDHGGGGHQRFGDPCSSACMQGLVMQSLLSGDIARLRKDAPGVFAVFERALEEMPDMK
jgi:hypothetical protein